MAKKVEIEKKTKIKIFRLLIVLPSVSLMSATTPVLLLLLLLFLFEVHSMTEVSRCKQFSRVLLCNGKPGCLSAVANLSVAFDLGFSTGNDNDQPCIPSATKCSCLCQRIPLCRSFNVRGQEGICQFYFYHPHVIQHGAGCEAFEMKKIGAYNFTNVTNLALGKRSCQSSSSRNGGLYKGSWLLVDGKLEGPSRGGLCAQTDETSSGPNWWMIDMELSIKVRKVFVHIDNSSLFYQTGLENVTLGVTNSSWLVARPTIRAHSVCGSNHGSPPYGSEISITCSTFLPPGRFLIIHQGLLGMKSTVFVICEVHIYSW